MIEGIAEEPSAAGRCDCTHTCVLSFDCVTVTCTFVVLYKATYVCKVAI